MNFNKGQSILGVILAMAIFALMASAIAGTSVGNLNSLNKGGEQSRAESLAQEAVEAIRGIKENAWNDLYSSSTISFAGYEWSFDSTNVQTIGDYTRTVTFSDVCRDAQNVIVACPGDSTDLQSKKVNVSVSWEIRPGVTNSVNKEFYLTNWDSREWIQSDWSGGPGQSVLSDASSYDSDDGGVDYSTVGEIKIAEQGGGTCTNTAWTFDLSTDYVYDTSKVEVSGGSAHLLKSFDANINGLADSLLVTEKVADSSDLSAPMHISGNLYVVKYAESAVPYNNYLKSYLLDSSGGITYVDSLLLGSSINSFVIKHVYGDVYSVFYNATYNGFSYVLLVQTFSINSLGIITEITSSYSFNNDVPNIYNFQVKEISQGVFTVLFQGDNISGTNIYYGNLILININNLGQVTIGGNIKYGRGTGFSIDAQKIMYLSGARYVLLYTETDQSLWSSKSYAKIVDINSQGITEVGVPTEMTSLTSGIYYVQMIAKTDNIFMMISNNSGVAGGPNGEVFVKTMIVNVDGSVSDIDTLVISNAYTYFNEIKYINTFGDTYAIMYSGYLYDANWVTTNSGGYLNTFTVDSNGSISDVSPDSYQFALGSMSGSYNISNFNADVFLLKYQAGISIADSTARGYIETINIDVSGNITPVDKLIYNDSSTSYTQLGHGPDSYYTIGYYKSLTSQFVVGLTTIDINGNISDVIDSFSQTVSNFNMLDDSLFNSDETITFYYRNYVNNAYALYFSSLAYGYNGQLYTTDNPTVKPTESFTFLLEEQLNSFSESASKGAGEIYYQLSDDDGGTWKYWNGGYWVTAGSTNYNVATTVSANISKFATSTGKLMFRAFLESDGSSQITLSSVALNCSQSYSWTFDQFDEYIFDPVKIQMVDGKAKLKLINQYTHNHLWDFTSAVGYDYDPFKIDISSNAARLKYIDPASTFNWDYNTSSSYTYDPAKVEFLSGQARLKHVGPALGAIANSVTDFENLGGTPAFATDIVKVRSDIYVYVYNLDNYANGSRTVNLVTKRISADGTVISEVLSTRSFGVNSALQTGSDDFSDLDVVKISDGIIGVAYSSGYYTYVSTLSIDANGIFASISTGTVYNYVLSAPKNVSIVKVENAVDIYAVAFDYMYNASDVLYLKTISIASNGTIGSVISTLAVGTDDSYGSYDYKNPNLMYVSGDVYVLSYDYKSPYNWELSTGQLKSFVINSSGAITMPSGQTLDSNIATTMYNRNTSMVKLSDNYIAAVYQDKNRNGWIKTYNVNSSGMIALVQSFQYKVATDGSYPDIVSLGSDNYAIISNKVNDYGTIDTFNISATGVINTTAIDSYTYENGDGDSGQLENVGTGIYALAYQNSAGGLALSTITISSAGDITNSLIATSVVGGGPIQRPIVTNVRDDIYLYTYADNGGTKLYLATKRIANDGTIDPNVLSSMTLTVYGTKYVTTKISNGYFAIGYSAYISTYSVSDTGVISFIQTYNHTTSDISDLVKLEGSANVYAIASNQYNSYIGTVTISNVGVIGTLIDTFSYLSPNGGYTNYTKIHINTRLLYISGNVYAVSYDVKQDYPTYKSITEIITINIDTNGSITQTNTVLDLINLDTKMSNADGYVPDYGTTMVRVSNDYIAISYTKTDGITYLGTLNITSAGIMPTSLNYSLTYGSGTALKYPKLISLAETFYALSYTLNSQMILDTYNISTLGVITTPKVDTLTYDNYGSGHSNLVRVNGNIFAIAHKTSSNSAALTTLSIEATGVYSATKPTVVAYRDDFGVSSWTSFVETSNLNGGSIYYQLSHDNINWFYLNTTSSSWLPVANASLDYSSYSVINSNINTFITSTSKLYAKAFLISDGTQKVGLDNVAVSVSRSVYGYATDRPFIINNVSRLLSNNAINSFETFTASISNPSGGNVFFQISDDAVTWKYFDGLRWLNAVDNTQVNTATEVNQYIQMFSPQNKKLYMKAIFVSDGVQQVTLNSVTVGVMVTPADSNTTNLWHFDEASGNMIDVIGNYNIAPYSGVLFAQSGKFGNSVKSGSSGYISYTATMPKLPNNFTLEVWVKAMDTYFGQAAILNGMYVSNQPGNTGGYSLTIANSGRVYFYLNKGGPTLTSATYSATDGQWNHIAITYNGSYIYMYVNGVYKTASYFVGTIYNNYGSFRIGQCSSSYPCYMDEMRISNVARWTGTSNFTPPTFPSGNRARYTSGAVSVESRLPYNFSSSLSFASFIESATKNNGEIYYQLSDDDGVTWKYFDGTNWSTAGSSNYNTATVVTNNIVNFPTSTGSVSLKTFFVSDGTQYMDIDNATLNWEAGEGGGVGGGSGGGSGGGFATSTYFISSAFDMGDASPAQYLDWDEDLTACTDCSIKIQVSTAPDNGGVPGTWTPWYGVGGADEYFVDYFGSIIPNYLNGRRWVRYRVELLGDGTSTPVFKEMRINYK